MKFSQKLSSLMAEHGLTQQKLGQKLGVNHASVSGWLSGAMPHPRRRKQVADHFGLSVQDLFDDSRALPGVFGAESPPSLPPEEEKSFYQWLDVMAATGHHDMLEAALKKPADYIKAFLANYLSLHKKLLSLLEKTASEQALTQEEKRAIPKLQKQIAELEPKARELRIIAQKAINNLVEAIHLDHSTENEKG